MRVTLILAVLVVAALAAGAARGVTPGTNGAIYFENFSEESESSEIFVIDASGNNLRALTNTPDSDETEPAVSPNGNQIAFLSNVGNQGFHLDLMNKDGSGTHALAAGGFENSAPTWSPNSTQIAFGRCIATDAETGDCTSSQIAVIGSNNQNLRVLTPRVAGAVDSRPTWAPNGKKIVFQRTNADGIVSLWSVNATGTSVERILNDGSDVDRNAAYTPNGQRLIFASDVGDSEGIWQVNPNGHGKKRLFQESPDPEDPTIGGGTENPAVSPNGKQIVYTSGGDLWTASINGKNRTQLTKDGGDEADWARG